MTIETFIKKAIEGGWKYWLMGFSKPDEKEWKEMIIPHGTMCAILFNPEAWKAVAKVEKWGGIPAGIDVGGINTNFEPWWKKNMHKMIDYLAEGKSIEQFLATL